MNNGISGLKGHRSVGGYRASIYNALSIESVDELINCMQLLEQKNKKMKILANDGISQSGIDNLEKNGFEVLTTNGTRTAY